METSKTRSIVFCALFVALIAAGAFIKIPTPTAPVTLQNLFTMLAGLLLGRKRGCIAVCIYIALGLIGLPVFASGGGIGYIFRPSFGYIIGFAAGAFVTGTIAHKTPNPGYTRVLAANFAGLGIIYLCGMIYYFVISAFYLNSPIGLWPLFLYCFLIYLPGDIALCILGAILGKRLIPLLRRTGLSACA
ncbi:MAG TPA: biotin transporter BioY [Candidatus Monoglobus merdigallinarum]|uniref:Biotin transporter n=1 Tax=Candidatus Monoglobus merdigallinarum TaxID=2838698 RepID=A0A9D1TLV7_9FIRM|nr:biotin transporter BioY [Candidatus Monoglobus merdigallinarum]